MPSYKQFEVQQEQDVTVVHLVEPETLDHLLADELRTELTHLVESRSPSKLLVNFGRVERYPTAAISSLLSVKRQLPDGGQLKCCGDAHNDVHRACRFLKLEGTVLDIYESSSDAIASF